LSTPHNGSVGADVLEHIKKATDAKHELYFSGFPLFAPTIAQMMPWNEGTPSMATWATALFNASNIRGLPADIVYNAVGGDADSNGNGEIDASPDEYEALRLESARLRRIVEDKGLWYGAYVIDRIYQFLRSTSGVTVKVTRWEGSGPQTEGRVIYTTEIIAVDSEIPLLNDTRVTVLSARGQGTYEKEKINKGSGDFRFYRFLNHCNVAGPRVAEWVTAKLKAVDESRGDLRVRY
jgi:hypothetical protein